MKLALPVETINATLEYLAARPYREVMNLIPAIQAAQPVDDGAPKDFTVWPNGGGLVHKDAVVHESAFVEKGCIVFGVVGEGARVTGGSFIYHDDVVAGSAHVHRLNCSSEMSKMHFANTDPKEEPANAKHDEPVGQ